MAKPLSLLAAALALTIAGCGRSDHQAPAPAESLTPVPDGAPAPKPGASEPGSTRPSPEPAADECGADKLGEYLNALPTADLLDKVRGAVAHERLRVISPGDVVTMDFRPDRLNIEVGADGRIKLFRCG